MKLLLFISVFLIGCISVLAQVKNLEQYNNYMREGKECIQKENLFDAYEKFRKAEYWAGNDKNLKKDAQDAMDKTIRSIKQQKKIVDSLLIVAENEKQKVINALEKADHMQKKLETSMFDKAIKEHFNVWRGYEKYNWEYAYFDNTKKGLEILNKIDSLDLSSNTLLRIPENVANCPNLKFLNLLDNPDIDWEASENTLSKLNNRVGMYLSINDISEIDSIYWYLLSGIEILDYKLKSIPQNIINQNQLKYLDLTGVGLNKLSPEICELKNLIVFSLNGNNLEYLPQEFGKLTNLTRLDLGDNQLITLPQEIGNLTKLNYLDLYENELSTLPPEFGQLINLTATDLEDNKLSNLPAEIGNLKNLNTLYLEGNPLTTLPSKISELTNLKELSLSVDSLSELPNEIRKLKNLTILYLESKKLGTLPVEISKLTNLTELHLSMDSLSALPPEISKLTNLTLLSLHGNKLKTLPVEIGNLSNLKELILNIDSLSDLPPEIGKLSKLKRLELDVSNLQSLPSELFTLNLTYDNYFDIGQLLFKAKNFQKALKSYLRSIEINNTRTNVYTYGNAGLCYRLIGDMENALKYLNKYLSLKENDVWCLNQLSYTYAAMNNFVKAFEYAEKSNKIKLSADVWSETGNQLSSIKKYEQALKSYLRSIDIDSTETNATIYGNLGSCYGKLGNPTKAVEYYNIAYTKTKKLILIDSTNYNNWFNLSFYCSFVNKYPEGIRAALKSLELAEKNESVYTNLALNYVLNNQYNEKAKPLYEKWKDIKFHDDDRLPKVMFLQDIKDLEDANITHPDFEKVRELFKE